MSKGGVQGKERRQGTGREARYRVKEVAKMGCRVRQGGKVKEKGKATGQGDLKRRGECIGYYRYI